MKAVILAGGLGTRLRPFTEIIPKPLLPIGERSVLEVQIDKLKSHGFNEIFLATNYKSQYIEGFFGDGSRYGVNLEISKESKPLGTAGPLLLLKDRLKEPFIVMNGDILSLINFTEFYEYANLNEALLTISVKKEITPFDFGNIYFDENVVTGIEEKPDIVSYILAGIYVMRPEIFKFFPPNEYFGMDQLIKKMISENEKIIKYDLHEYWLDIGRIDDYNEAQVAAKQFLESKK